MPSEAPPDAGEQTAPPAAFSTLPALSADTAARTLPCPEIAPADPELRFGPGARGLECTRPGLCRPQRELIDAPLAAVIAALGPPQRCDASEWRYAFPPECARERELLILKVELDRPATPGGEPRSGRVLEARYEHAFAGEGCVERSAPPR